MTSDELFMIKGVVEYRSDTSTHHIEVGLSLDWYAVDGHADRVTAMLRNYLPAYVGVSVYEAAEQVDTPRIGFWAPAGRQ